LNAELVSDLLTVGQAMLAIWGICAAFSLLRLSHRMSQAWDRAKALPLDTPPSLRQRKPPKDAFGLVWLMVGLCIAAAVSEAGWVMARAAGRFGSAIRADIVDEVAAGRVVIVLVLLAASAFVRLAEKSWTDPPAGR